MLANIDIDSFKIPITCLEAIVYLETLNKRLALLSLYQKIFPQQWLESTISIEKHSHKGSAYFDREIEFIQLVDEHLFPIEYVSEIELLDEHDDILVSPQRLDWRNEYFEDLIYSEKFFLSLMGQGYNISEWELNFGFTPDYIHKPENINLEKLSRLCRYSKQLQHLDTAIKMMDYTGNIWLDTTYETSDLMKWTYENVVFLAQQWQEAVLMIKKTNEIADFIETSFSARKSVVTIWNKAAI